METHPAFSVVLAYDKYADGICAKEFFDRLVFDHGELFQFTCHLWRFDVLQEPQLFDAATRDALGADMIVFAVRQNQEPPVEARRWIDRWLSSKQADSSALVLLQGGQPGQVGVAMLGWATLKQMAESANVRFFCREIASLAVDSHLAAQIANSVSARTAELTKALVKRSPTQSLTKV